MAKKGESRLQLNIKKDLKREVGGKWWKVHGGAFQEAGQPDIDGVSKGLPFKFEVKLPHTGKPSAIQLQTLEEWRDEGCLACIVETSAQAITLVKAAQACTGKRRKGRKLYRWICRTLRAAFGEDLGYGRPVARRKAKRRPDRWAQDQLKVNVVKVPRGETWGLHGMP